MTARPRPPAPDASPATSVGDRTVIGLVSDTHGRMRPDLAVHFAGVDRIVHAGDVGGRAVLEALAAIAPVEAVSGNVDDRSDPSLPRARTLPVGRLTLHVSHGDELGSPKPDALLAAYAADILVYGHTHRPLLHRAPDGRVVVNPGSAGAPRFGLRPSLAILTVEGTQVDVRFIELA